jgi:hypothetical protein
MKRKINWIQIVFVIGVIAFVIGILDPLEGSVVITAGSLLIALSAWLKNDRHKGLFAAFFVIISLGVFFLFYFSSLGGFGEGASLSWWWGILVLPYPAGWIAEVALLILRAVHKRRIKKTAA